MTLEIRPRVRGSTGGSTRLETFISVHLPARLRKSGVRTRVATLFGLVGSTAGIGMLGR